VTAPPPPPPGPAHRIGHGFDLHRLEPGPQLVLAGVTVSEDVRPVAHSDGDVVLHALVDALLGAMGWGDIGEHFPNDEPRWKDAPSRVFVETVYGKVRAAGYAVGNVDVTILAERPRLKAFKPRMVESVAAMLGVAAGRVNVKAGTNEGVDAVGRGEAVAAHAVVLLVALAADAGKA
jgi:2-C-methyl-D-erythritol 2,4-cyclodiphosphate synthase